MAPHKYRCIAVVSLLAAAFVAQTQLAAAAKPKVNVEGKIVLANVDRYPAHFRAGKVRKKVAPKKASLLSPKKFPVTIEIWSGTPGRASWQSQAIPAAGIYTFRFQRDRWRLTKAQPRQKAKRSSATRTRRTTYRRSTGSRPRVVRRGGGGHYYGHRVPLLRRVAGDVLWLYRFVRDEEDRDLLRDIIIGREIDAEVERELLDRLDGIAETLPSDEKLAFERALDNLNNLNEKDIQDLEAATDDEWGAARESLGDEVTDDDWQAVESDFADLQVDDLSEAEVADLGDVGIDSLESDVDIGDLDSEDFNVGDLGGTLENVDLGDLGGAVDDVDIGDLGGDFGGGLDAGGLDAGGLDAGGLDAGGLDYDAGGFDDFGGGMDDFGGGGGFDDFGGGGFDDFGGGFDF